MRDDKNSYPEQKSVVENNGQRLSKFDKDSVNDESQNANGFAEMME